MIEAMGGAALADALSGLTASMAGNTLSDNYNRYMTDNYDTVSGSSIGYGNWLSNKPAITGSTSGTIVTSQSTDPSQAFDDYVEENPDSVNPISGGIEDGSTASTFNFSILLDNEDACQAVAQVAVPITLAYSAIAKGLGVAVDSERMNIETKRVFAEAMSSTGSVIYDKAKDMVIAWRDKLGNILFPKEALDSVQSAIEELNIGGSAGKISDIFPTAIPTGTDYGKVGGSGTYDILETTGALVALTGSSGYFYYGIMVWLGDSVTILRRWKGTNTLPGEDLQVWNVDSTLTYTYTHDGKTVRYSDLTNGYTDRLAPPIAIEPPYFTIPSGYTKDQAAWTMAYGRDVSGGYPEGTAESDAPTTYTPSTWPVSGSIATSPDGTNSIPVVPVNIPDYTIGSNNEIEVSTIGDDTAVTNPTEDDKSDSLPQSPALPIPDTNVSNPDVPLTDASVVNSTLINELVEELANTVDPQPGQSSGIIPIPPMPGIQNIDPDTGLPDGTVSFPSIVPASGSGFIHVYNPTPGEFVSFGNWLWVTYADATIDKIWNNPFDGVIGAHELYATPNRDGSDNIRSGFLTCPTTAALVRNRYSEIDCGTIIVPEFYGNYLDYSPYSQAYIYLPFIGINEVSIDDIVGHAVNVRYRVDSYTGSCIAMIFVAKDGYQNLCYQFAGSCSVEVPLAGGSQAAIKAGVLQAEAYARSSLASAALSGAQAIGAGLGTGGLAGGLIGGLSALGGMAGAWYGGKQSVEAARVANKSSVQHSGQFGASHGAMGEKIPFIIIRNPVQVKVVNYNEEYGYPAHKRVIIGGCTGYLRAREVNVISAHATDAEKAAIEALLKNGVYVS